MKKCFLCGKKITDYFDLCWNCHDNTISSQYNFAEPIIAGKFMKEMGIIGYGG